MDKRKENPLVIKIVCIIASFALWLYINGVENPIRTEVIKNIPVNIINSEALIEQGIVISPNQKFTVDLSVKAPSSEIAKLKAQDFNLTADLEGYAFKAGEYKVKVTVNSKPQGEYTIIDSDLNVKVKFDEYVSLNVPVKLNIDANAKAGYNSFTPETKVSSATVSGPSEYVNSVSYVLAKETYKELEGDLTVKLPLTAYDNNNQAIDTAIVQVKPESIYVVIPVKRTKIVPINIKTKGELTDKTIAIASLEATPKELEISGDSALLDSISYIDTEELDISDLNQDTTKEVNVILPQNITLKNTSSTVGIKITTVKVVQKTFNLSAVYTNLADGYSAEFASKEVIVTVSGSEQAINELKDDGLNCYVDLGNNTEGEYLLSVFVKVPEGVKGVNVSPEKLKVKIIKESSETNSNAAQ